MTTFYAPASGHKKSHKTSISMSTYSPIPSSHSSRNLRLISWPKQRIRLVNHGRAQHLAKSHARTPIWPPFRPFLLATFRSYCHLLHISKSEPKPLQIPRPARWARSTGLTLYVCMYVHTGKYYDYIRYKIRKLNRTQINTWIYKRCKILWIY